MCQARGWLVIGLAGLLSAGAARAANVNSLYDPALPGGYNAAAFNPVANVTFNYQTGTLTDGATVWTGTLEAAGSTVGNIQMWVFRFDSVSVASGISIDPYDGTGATQKPGLVLASRGDMTFDGAIHFGGGDTAANLAGKGGPGAEGGLPGTSYASGPPPANAGNGGGNNGIGRGGSIYNFNGYGGNSGGASYGGLGGGQFASNLVPTYGDDLLADLYGGSGSSRTYYTPGGAGGGGAVELVASATLAFSGSIDVGGGHSTEAGQNGGEGGGSGGGVLLAGGTLNFSGSIDASGGDVWSTQWTRGGGGGGGRVAFYANALTNAGTVDVSHGAGGADANNPPTDGTFRFAGDGLGGDLSMPFTIPEPATLGLLGLGAIGMLAARGRRRRRT